MRDKDRDRIFESDRRMQLRLRLAAKRATESPVDVTAVLPIGTPPEREVVRRLIERVLRL